VSLGWILSRARDVHGGFDYMAQNISSDAHTLGAFNMLLLFAFCFCYASSRAAFCIRRIQTFDVRMNGYFRATPAVALRVNVYADYVCRSGDQQRLCLRAAVYRLNKHEIFNKLRGIFRKVPKQFRNAAVESNGERPRSAIQFQSKSLVVLSLSLSLSVSPSGSPSWDILFCKIPDIPAQSCPRF